MLLDAGAEKDVGDYCSRTPLMYAAGNGRKESRVGLNMIFMFITLNPKIILMKP